MATATKIRLRFQLTGSGRQIRPGFWAGNPDTNVAVPVGTHAAIVGAARAQVAASGLMAGYDDSVVFQEAEAQNFTRVQFPDRYNPKTGDAINVFGWEATTTTTESAGADIPGTLVGDSLPPNCSGVFSLYSAEPGPDGRNRYYGPPPMDSEVNSEGTIDAARVTQLEADMQSILTAIVAVLAVNETIVVASATRNDLSGVTRTVIQSRIRSQRSRLLG